MSNDFKEILQQFESKKKYYTQCEMDAIYEQYSPNTADIAEKSSNQVDITIQKSLSSLLIQDTIDLHYMTIRDAEKAVSEFLSHSIHKKLLCVRVIVGKGLHSKRGKSLLQVPIKKIIEQHNGVYKFCSGKAKDGGTGIIIVYMKSCLRK